MDSNAHSNQPAEPPGSPGSPGSRVGSGGLAFLTMADQELAAEDLDGLSATALAEGTVALQQAMDRLTGHWLRRLAAGPASGVDGRVAAGSAADERQHGHRVGPDGSGVVPRPPAPDRSGPH